ncbi:MAG TPA: ATP-binding protein [Chthoniobacterales bacterium]|nr:ATP-binding protein [Chthoniobacterales bacterium]
MITSSPNEVEQAATAALRVPMTNVTRFVRQLSHDLRNHLNAAELQSAYVTEIASDGEVKAELQRLRGMLSEMGRSLQRVSAALTPLKLTRMPYEAAALVEDLRQKFTSQMPEESASVRWSVNCGSAQLDVDPQLLQQALLELLTNAFQHGRGVGPIEITAETEDNSFVFRLREPKAAFEASTTNWGHEPFSAVGHEHYGLGLHRATSIIEAHEGRLSARYDSASSSLVTTVALPILPPA